MVLNYIFVSFFLIAFAIGLFRLIVMGDVDVFPAMMNSTFDSAKTAFEISLGLTGVLSLWLGIMKIGEKGGVVNVIARLLSPVFCKLFPDIPKGHPVTGSIFMNIAANMPTTAVMKRPSTSSSILKLTGWLIDGPNRDILYSRRASQRNIL